MDGSSDLAGSSPAHSRSGEPRSRPDSSSPPRVYWLTEGYFPPVLGGLELIAATLSEGMAARGAEVHVITRQPEELCPEEEYLNGVHVRRIPPRGLIKGTGWRALPLMLSFLARLAFILIREAKRYDVVIVSGMKIIPLIAVPLCMLLRKRCIIRIESTAELTEAVSDKSLASMRGSLGRVLRAVSERIQRLMLSHADRVIATSGELWKMTRAAGIDEAKISTIANAIDMRKFHPVSEREKHRLRRRLYLPRRATIVLFASRLSRAKGIDLLVRAWPKILADHSNLCLVIVGSGTESFDDCESELAEFIRGSGLSDDRVRMVGPSEEVDRYLQASDLYILPSEYEGFGVGIIEALASGVPVLTTPVGVVPQLIRDGHNGFVFQPRNERALVAAVDKALAARERWPEIRTRARGAVASMDIRAIVQQYMQLCTDLVRE